jgi:hypothetical protein
LEVGEQFFGHFLNQKLKIRTETLGSSPKIPACTMHHATYALERWLQ